MNDKTRQTSVNWKQHIENINNYNISQGKRDVGWPTRRWHD